MRLCRVLAPPAPGAAVPVAEVDDPSQVVAAIVDGNPLADDFDVSAVLGAAANLASPNPEPAPVTITA